MKRRVVITGLGAVTPIGNTVNEFWNGIKEEKVGIGEITKFDTEDYKVKIAAEVKDFNVKERLDNKAAYSSSSDYAPSEPPCNPQVYLLSARYRAPGQTDFP